MKKTWRKGYKGPFTKQEALSLGRSVMKNNVPNSTIEAFKIRKVKNQNVYNLYFLAEW